MLLKLLEPENKSDLLFLRSKPKPGKIGLDSVSFWKKEVVLSFLRFNPGNNGVFDSFLTSIVSLFKPNPGNNDVEVFLGISMLLSVFALDNSNFGKSDDVVLNSKSLLLLLLWANILFVVKMLFFSSPFLSLSLSLSLSILL